MRSINLGPNACCHTTYLPAVPLQWHIAGVGDFNGDVQADLVWENTVIGQRTIWFLKNGFLSSSIYLPTVALECHIAGTGDFNGDGNADFSLGKYRYRSAHDLVS
ncbi:MAG TPA: VCBS repeat-containing protein [Chthoniobacterales bacterium]|nr:VCBS repeat-containing protein [Chthoniobacterales bacterium]